jgi:hypothetical protein
VKFSGGKRPNKCHCVIILVYEFKPILTPPEIKSYRTYFAAVAPLGEVDRNCILSGTLSVNGFSHFHSRIAKGFFSIK